MPPSCILIGSEYLALPREPEAWLIKPLIPAGGSVIIYGDPKVGKSYAALQLSLALVEGKDWMGFPVVKNGRVVYVQLDTPRSLWTERLDDLKRYGISGVDKVHFADRETLDAMPFSILEPTHFLRLTEALKVVAPIAVIIDTIRESHGADENDSTAMRNVVAALAAATHPAALILISHARKPAQDASPSLLGDQRGSGYVVGRMDSILRFSKHYINYTGRAVEEGSIKIIRQDSGFWIPTTSEIDIHIATIMADTNLDNNVVRSKALAALTGKSADACRSLIRRFESRHPHPHLAEQ